AGFERYQSGAVPAASGGKRYSPLCLSRSRGAVTPGAGAAGETSGYAGASAAGALASYHFGGAANRDAGLRRACCWLRLYAGPRIVPTPGRDARNISGVVGTVDLLYVACGAGYGSRDC